MTATSGRRFTALLSNVGPAGACLRMLLGTSRWGSTACYLTWKLRATKHGRLLFRLSPSMPHTAAIESGSLLPTPQHSDATGGKASKEVGGTRPSGAKRSISLATAVRHGLYPTPTASDANSRTVGTGEPFVTANGTVRRRNEDGSSSNLGLTHTARLLPTPTRADGERTSETYGRGNRTLRGAPLPEACSSGRLNPAFVEWMMGYPPGWVTPLEPSATR